jgi:hypothetical protein
VAGNNDTNDKHMAPNSREFSSRLLYKFLIGAVDTVKNADDVNEMTLTDSFSTFSNMVSYRKLIWLILEVS